jgi:hypothetical protein
MVELIFSRWQQQNLNYFCGSQSIYDESHHRHNTMSCSHWRSLSSFAFGLIYSTIRGYCGFLVCLYRLQVLTRCFFRPKTFENSMNERTR